MRYSVDFHGFRKILRELNVDLQRFVDLELERGPLTTLGWTKDALQALFEIEFEPLQMPTITCRLCNRRGQYGKETSWQVMLERWITTTQVQSEINPILQAREAAISDCEFTEFCVCFDCEEKGLDRTQATANEYGSYFLSPLLICDEV
jgi:hypothetical protein